MERQAADLAGQVVLVVEDEYLVARELAEELRRDGAMVLGPLPGLAEAMKLIGTETPISAAVLDVNLHGERVWPAVDALGKRGVPVLLTTGYGEDAIPPAYTGLPRLEKPVSPHDAARLLAAQVAGGNA